MPQKYFKITIALTILIIFLIRIFYSFPNAPLLDTDAIFSVEAARSIIETGIPLKTNGEFYPRDYLTHYLLAGSIFLFGDNPIGYVIPNLIFSVLVLILLYFFAKEFTKSKMVIFLTIFFVGISTVENTYALNPRSYMQFQFFFLLTVFLFYKGFVKKNDNKEKVKKYKILTTFSYIASYLSHLSGLILMPIFGFYIIIKNKKWYKDKLVIIFFSIISAVFIVFICVIDSCRVIKTILASLGLFGLEKFDGPLTVSFNFFSNFPNVFLYLPFISVFIIIGIIEIIEDRNRKLAYLYYIFLLSILSVSFFSNVGKIKYIFCIFPIFTFLSFIGINYMINFFSKKITIKNNTKSDHLMLAAIIIILLIFIFVSLTREKIKYFPYSFDSFFNDAKDGILYVSKNKQEKDILICSDPMICLFYLNQCDYSIIQKKIRGINGELLSWGKFNPITYNPYNTQINYIDSLNKLKRVLNNNQRVWLVLSRKTFGLQIAEYIQNDIELKYGNHKENFYIYFFERKIKQMN